MSNRLTEELLATKVNAIHNICKECSIELLCAVPSMIYLVGTCDDNWRYSGSGSGRAEREISLSQLLAGFTVRLEQLSADYCLVFIDVYF